MSAVELARATIRALLLAGVTEFVLAPGSRNSPLSLELAEAESRGLLRLHVRIDERSAGFLALGLAKAGRVASAVLSTSGTAVANFLPAVVEASMSRTPIAVVTANRPLSMLGTGANQTIRQVGIFGDFARTAVHIDDRRPEDWNVALRGAALAMSSSPVGAGPVQIDLGLSPPLVSRDLDFITPVQPEDSALRLATQRAHVEVELPPRSLVVIAECDPELAATVSSAAMAAGYPVHIEAGSSLEFSDGALRAGTFLLRSDLPSRHRPDHVLIVGRPTLSRHIPALVASGEIAVTVVSDDPSLANPMQLGSPALWAFSVGIVGAADGDFAAAWRAADEAAAVVIDEQTSAEFDAGAAVALVHQSAPDLLIVASSNPIRDLDERAIRRSQRVIVNRGAAGIDGLVSSAIGAALADQAPDDPSRPVAPRRRGSKTTTATALLGDLAFLHDSNGLIMGPGEPRPDLSIVVINNDGGAIFASLEQGAPAYAEHFERVFGTPHGVDIEALCAATSTPYLRCDDSVRLCSALEMPTRGVRVIEVHMSREGEREHRRAFTDRVVNAINATLSS